jgi:hypothetical protein
MSRQVVLPYMPFSSVEGFPGFAFNTPAKLRHHCPIIRHVVACDMTDLWPTGVVGQWRKRDGKGQLTYLMNNP